jgi:hypothetical protein
LAISLLIAKRASPNVGLFVVALWGHDAMHTSMHGYPTATLSPDRYALPADINAHRIKLLSVQGDLEKFDHAFERQFFGIVGLDAIVGLFPLLGIGDAVSGATTVWLLVKANQVKLSFGDQATIIGLGAADYAIGSVPLAGDAADVFFRAHAWNSARILNHIRNQLTEIETVEGGLVKSVPVQYHKENLSLLRDSLLRGGKTRRAVWIRIGIITAVCLSLLTYCAHSIYEYQQRVEACQARTHLLLDWVCQITPGD